MGTSIFPRLHCPLPNPSHDVVDNPTNPIHLIDSTTSKFIDRSLSYQKFLDNMIALCRGRFPVHIPVILVMFTRIFPPYPTTTISSLPVVSFSLARVSVTGVSSGAIGTTGAFVEI